MPLHNPPAARPLYSTPPETRAEILEAYDAAVKAASRHVVGGELTLADRHGLRRRVSTICGVSVEQVSDAIAARDMEARQARAAAARPRHPITKGIE